MRKNVARKLIETHLADGKMEPGEEIALRIDQTLTQDATGTLVMLEFEAMQIPRVKTELSAQYVDHNLLQIDFKNADDHLYLLSACRKFGLWYSRPGNGVSHPVHMERFGIPGKTLLGSDSHTCAAGSLGMLAIGAGGLEVAMAMAGEPFHVKMPKVWGVKLTGRLPDWVSAKDIVLEMLRRHGVDGGIGKIVFDLAPKCIDEIIHIEQETMLETVGAMRFNNFINVHSVGHPVEQMMSLCSVVVGGVLERFPQLRVAFLESGIGWLPFMMDRLDEEIEKRGEDEAPWLKANPSEYITGGRCFFGVECGEKTIADAVRWGLENALLYASDYPHWDGDWPHTVKKVRERQDLSASIKQKMLHDNAVRFYKLATN